MEDIELTKDFNLSEFLHSEVAVRRGIDNTPPAPILQNIREHLAPGMQRIRDLLRTSVLISSGFRCEALNAAIGGSRTSLHMTGLAADFTAPRFGTPRAVMTMLVAHMDALSIDQIILEGDRWIHASFAPAPRKSALVATFGQGAPKYSKWTS